MMRNSRHRHPDVLSSLIFVRTASELAKGSRISSLALFTVVCSGKGEAKFRIFHSCFDPTQDREAILAGVCRMIPKGAQLLVRQPWPDYLPAWIDNPGIGLPLLDNGRLAGALPGTTLLPLFCRDDQITRSGKALGLDMPDPGSTPLKADRRVPLEAFALWGIYLRSFTTRREARQLTAAFQAWQLIEKVKPLPSR